jgi:uncharacterized protein YndB with AHSA1/START domain
VTDEAAAGGAHREVELTRVFDAPRELVFRAWLDPAQIVDWWAPVGLRVPPETVEVDARPGGHINFSMVDTESGQDYPVRFEIVELAEPELLVLASPPVPELGMPARIVTRVSFEQDGDRTKVTVAHGPHTAEMYPEALAGWTSVLDKLEALLSG